MHTSTIAQIRKELQLLPKEALISAVLRLAKYKKDNKELLHFLLFESKESYVMHINELMDEEFDQLNRSSVYYAKKSLRKIQRLLLKHIRIMASAEHEIELRLYFCEKIVGLQNEGVHSEQISNIFDRQMKTIKTKIEKLHEDLQYEYSATIERLTLHN